MQKVAGHRRPTVALLTGKVFKHLDLQFITIDYTLFEHGMYQVKFPVSGHSTSRSSAW